MRKRIIGCPLLKVTDISVSPHMETRTRRSWSCLGVILRLQAATLSQSLAFLGADRLILT